MRAQENQSLVHAGSNRYLHLLVFASMVLVLGVVLQQYAMQLLDMVLRGGDSHIAVKDHVHRIGIARHFLFVAAGE